MARRRLPQVPHSRCYILVAIAASVLISNSAHALVIGKVTGPVTANFSLNTDNTTYSFINASASLNINVPVIPVSATSSGYWSDPLTWNGAPILLVNDGVTISGVFSNVVEAALDIPNEANTLINSGPTEQSIGIPGFSLSSSLGINASFGAFANLSYDVTIPTTSITLMDQPTVAVHSLFVESGATLTGNGNFIVRTDLTNQGTLYNLGGTIQGNFNNSGPFADITGPLSVRGSFSNFGTIAIEMSGLLNLSQPSSNDGTIRLYGGSISVSGALTNNGSVQWYGGSILQQFQNEISGTLIISGSGNKYLSTNGLALDNVGTIKQIGNATTILTFNGNPGLNFTTPTPAILLNEAGGVYDIQGDGGMNGQAGGFGTPGAGIFQNAGLFKKSSGSGISNIGVPFNNIGTVEVDSGTLALAAGGTGIIGRFVINNGSEVMIVNNYNLDGINNFTGNGMLEIPNSYGSIVVNEGHNATINAASGVTVLLDGGNLSPVSNGSTTTLTLSGLGSFRWIAGSVSGGGFVINASPTLMISGSGNKYLSINGLALDNTGTIRQIGDATTVLTFSGNPGLNFTSPTPAILSNEPGAVYDIQGDGGMNGQANGFGAPGAGVFQNAGLFKKSSGSGISNIGVPFNNTGIIEIDSGTLALAAGGTSAAGNFAINNGSEVMIVNNYNLDGINTFTGNGTLEIPNSYGSIVVNDGHSATINAASGVTLLLDGGNLSPAGSGSATTLTLSGLGAFKWTAGSIFGGSNGVVINASQNFTLSGSGNKYLSTNGLALDNVGTIKQIGNATTILTFNGNPGLNFTTPTPAILLNEAGGVYDIQGDGGMNGQAGGFGTPGAGIFQNAGLFKKSSGSGISNIGVPFNNIGTVEVDSGMLAFSTLNYASSAKTVIALNSSFAFGYLAITNPTTILGSLLFNLSNGYTPKLGDSFTFLTTSSSFTGEFSTTSTTAALPTDVGIAITYTPNAATATIALLGDANLDGHVDLTDLSTILNNFGTTTPAWTSGNFDHAPTIDLTDLSSVLNNFGSIATPSVATPEPTSITMLVASATLLVNRRRKAI